jgi:hypothetical protein
MNATLYDNLRACLGSLHACVNSLITHSGDISTEQSDEIRAIYNKLLIIQQDVIKNGPAPIPEPAPIVGLSSKLKSAAEVILDNKVRARAMMGFILDKDRVERGFCLSCHLYTRNLSELELNELLQYFVGNGYPWTYIDPPNKHGERFIFLKDTPHH